jgi:hypothetical protein
MRDGSLKILGVAILYMSMSSFMLIGFRRPVKSSLFPPTSPKDMRAPVTDIALEDIISLYHFFEDSDIFYIIF